MGRYEYVNDKVYRWGEHDEGAISQIQTCSWDGRSYRGALMADGHKGYSMPVGGVMAYHGLVSPSGVGFDIGCGNKAVRLNIKGLKILGQVGAIMDEIFSSISFGVGRVNNEDIDHDVLRDPVWDLDCMTEIWRSAGKRAKAKYGSLRELAAAQLGTIGSGNHYVDLFVDENDDVWCGVHFGSRGMGHSIATHFLHAAGGKDEMDAYPTLIDADSDLGKEYIECMNLAGRYAYAGRDWVCQKVASIIGAKIVEEIHNHHNFAWLENHDGHDVWVVRKGATPAFPGQKGFVGGSMGDKSVILEGIESDEAKLGLYSTVHGAGRVMGRMQAKGKFKTIKDDDGNVIETKCVREPLVKESEMMEWVRNASVELRGAGVDESPHCYKRIDEVLDYHSGSIKIVHTLTPIGVAMASADVRDPYKD